MREKVIVYNSVEQEKGDVNYVGYLRGFSVDRIGSLQYPVAIVEEAITGRLLLPYPAFIRVEKRTDEELSCSDDIEDWAMNWLIGSQSKKKVEGKGESMAFRNGPGSETFG